MVVLLRFRFGRRFRRGRRTVRGRRGADGPGPGSVSSGLVTHLGPRTWWRAQDKKKNTKNQTRLVGGKTDPAFAKNEIVRGWAGTVSESSRVRLKSVCVCVCVLCVRVTVERVFGVRPPPVTTRPVFREKVTAAADGRPGGREGKKKKTDRIQYLEWDVGGGAAACSERPACSVGTMLCYIVSIATEGDGRLRVRARPAAPRAKNVAAAVADGGVRVPFRRRRFLVFATAPGLLRNREQGSGQWWPRLLLRVVSLGTVWVQAAAAAGRVIAYQRSVRPGRRYHAHHRRNYYGLTTWNALVRGPHRYAVAVVRHRPTLPRTRTLSVVRTSSATRTAAVDSRYSSRSWRRDRDRIEIFTCFLIAVIFLSPVWIRKRHYMTKF